MSRKESLEFLPTLAEAGIDYLSFRLKRFTGQLRIPKEYDVSPHMSLVLTIWKKTMGISPKEVVKSGAYDLWALMRYWLNLYDDAIDNNPRQFPSKGDLKFFPWKEGKAIAEMTSDLVQRINQPPLREKRWAIFKILLPLEKNNILFARDFGRNVKKETQL